MRSAVMSDGAVLPYVASGAGPTVVFLHGALTDLRMWDTHRALLSDRFRSVAYTQRYFGSQPWQSGWPPFGIATHAADLVELIRLLDVGPVHLVAWSYAGHAVLAAALMHPERIASAFVYEPGVPSYVEAPADLAVFAADANAMFGPVFESVQSAGDVGEGVRRLIDGSAQRAGYFDSQPPERRAMQMDNARTLPLLLAQESPPTITADDLRSIDVPICIAHGGCTRPLFRVVSKAAGCLLRGGRHRLVPDADHMWPDIDAAGFSAALTDFIDDVERSERTEEVTVWRRS
jgi:pimeloyl-ACP methyl ester carboxylesterase